MSGLNSAAIGVSARDLAGGGPADVANIIAQTEVNRAQSRMLIPAQARQAEAQTGLIGQQTKQAEIETQTKGLDLQYRVASMNAAREAYNQINGVQSSPGPQLQNQNLPGQASMGPQGPSPSTPVSQMVQPASTQGASQQVSPDTPVSQVPQQVIQQRGEQAKATAANVDQSNHASVLQHAEAVPYNEAGAPNTLSNDYLTRVRDLTIKNGGDPILANNSYITGTKARFELTKGHADSVKAGNDAIKSGFDSTTAQAAAQTAVTESSNNVAFQAMSLAKSDPSKAQGYAASLGLNISDPQDQVTLHAMALGSTLGQRTKTTLVSNEVALRNAASTEEQVKIGKMNNAIAKGQLGVAQANQLLAVTKEAADITVKASSSAQAVDATIIAQKDINALKILSNPGLKDKVTRTGTSLSVITKNLPDSLATSLFNAGGRLVAGGASIEFTNINKRLSENLVEIQQRMISQGGGGGGLGTVSGMEVVSKAIANLDPTLPDKAYSENLEAAQRFVGIAHENVSQMHESYNKFLSGPQGLQSGFKPIKNALPPVKKWPPLGFVHNGHRYVGGDPDAKEGSWSPVTP